jgi:hypothetical protein
MTTTTDTTTVSKIATVDKLGRVKPVVIMLDPIIHDEQHPYCSDSTCPCQEEREARRARLPLNGNRPLSLLR